MNGTQLVAWWGAIVATLVLLWDVIKWVRSGPKIRKIIILNMHYSDGKIISQEKTDNGSTTEYEDYCHIELSNIGNMPTTIMNIYATEDSKGNNCKLHMSSQCFTGHFEKKLPFVLKVGEVWSCRLPMSHYQNLLNRGAPVIKVCISHLNNPLEIRAKKSSKLSINSLLEKINIFS